MEVSLLWAANSPEASRAPTVPERATLEDVPAIEALRAKIADDLAEEGIEQWQKPFPDEATQRASYQRDVEQGNFYVVRTEDRKIAACIALSERGNPRLWSDDERAQPALYFGKLMRDPDLSKPGLGRELVAWAHQEADRRGAKYLRAEVLGSNRRLQGYYANLGAMEQMRRWPHFPANCLIEFDIADRDSSDFDYECIEAYNPLKPEASLNNLLEVADNPFVVRGLTPRHLASWQQEFRCVTDGQEFPYYCNDLQYGGWLKNAQGENGSFTPGQYNQILPPHHYLRLLGLYGLSEITGWYKPSEDGPTLTVSAAERPLRDGATFDRAWEEFERTEYAGRGPLLMGAVSLDGAKFILADGAVVADDTILRSRPKPTTAMLAPNREIYDMALPCQRFNTLNGNKTVPAMMRLEMPRGTTRPRATVLQLPTVEDWQFDENGELR